MSPESLHWAQQEQPGQALPAWLAELHWQQLQAQAVSRLERQPVHWQAVPQVLQPVRLARAWPEQASQRQVWQARPIFSCRAGPGRAGPDIQMPQRRQPLPRPVSLFFV